MSPPVSSKVPKGIAGQQVLCYVLHGGRIDVKKKKKSFNEFKEMIDEYACYYESIGHGHLFD